MAKCADATSDSISIDTNRNAEPAIDEKQGCSESEDEGASTALAESESSGPEGCEDWSPEDSFEAPWLAFELPKRGPPDLRRGWHTADPSPSGGAASLPGCGPSAPQLQWDKRSPFFLQQDSSQSDDEDEELSVDRPDSVCGFLELRRASFSSMPSTATDIGGGYQSLVLDFGRSAGTTCIEVGTAPLVVRGVVGPSASMRKRYADVVAVQHPANPMFWIFAVHHEVYVKMIGVTLCGTEEIAPRQARYKIGPGSMDRWSICEAWDNGITYGYVSTTDDRGYHLASIEIQMLRASGHTSSQLVCADSKPTCRDAFGRAIRFDRIAWADLDLDEDIISNVGEKRAEAETEKVACTCGRRCFCFDQALICHASQGGRSSVMKRSPAESIPQASAEPTPQACFCIAQAAAAADEAPHIAPAETSVVQGSAGAAAAAFVSASECAPVEDEVHDWRTTVMIRDLPHCYSRADLMNLLDRKGFGCAYKFLYFPMDFRKRTALGYAFIDLADARTVPSFWEAFDGFISWGVPCESACVMSWCDPHQGLQAHIERYRNSPVMHHQVPDEYKPILLEHGRRVPFPAPTQEIRYPRLRDRQPGRK